VDDNREVIALAAASAGDLQQTVLLACRSHDTRKPAAWQHGSDV
jgi:hypothetical protein